MLKRPLYVGLIVSAFFHLFLMISVWVYPPLSQNETTSETIEVSVIEKRDLKEGDKKQIVQQEKQINDEIPEDAKYLSKHNQKVQRETKAKSHGAFKNRGGSPQKTLPTLKELKPKFNWGDVAVKRKQKVQKPKKEGASSTDDFLKGKNEGMETLLSTREFVFYSYYNRIRNQLRQYWEPKIKEKVRRIFRQGRNLASTQDRITKVVITLNEKGTLIRVQVLEQSGVRDLDEAAVEAFRAAAPFPNPPKGIVEKDGTIKIRWDFVLEA